MAQISGNKIIFDSSDWLGGQVFKYDQNTTPGLPIGGTLTEARAMNPYRFPGFVAPGYNPSEVTNATGLASGLRKGVVDGSNIYATGFTTDIAKITIGVTPSVVDDATWPYTIVAHGGANTPVADDCVIYTRNVSSTPTRRMMYSWTDSVSWDVGDFDRSSTFNDDFMQTVPASPLASPYTTGGQGKKHPLEVGADDILYMGDRQYIHAYDGYTGADGTFEAAVLTIPSGMEFRSFVKYAGYLVGFAYRQSTTSGSDYYFGEAKAYFWNYLSNDPDYVFDLGDNYVGEAFEYNGTIGVFTSGRANDLENSGSRSSKMQLFRGFGTGFSEEITFSTNIPERGGVWVNSEMIQWSSEGNVMSYGSPIKGAPRVLNNLAQGATSNTVEGMFMQPSTNFGLFSPSSASDGRLKYFTGGSNFADNCRVATANITPNFPEGKIGAIRSVKVFFAKTSSVGRSISIILVNQAQDTAFVTTNDATAITSSTIVKEYKKNDDRMRFSGLKAYLQYDAGSGATAAPIVDRIEVTFDEVNITK